jgi:CRP-like cAMP-binding protein
MEINLFRNARDAKTLASGEVLFREGDPGDTMFAVTEGQIALARDGEVLEDVGPGGILGEMALIDSGPRSATATATAPTRVVPVDQKHFTYLVHEHPTFALQVMTIMAERLRRTNG